MNCGMEPGGLFSKLHGPCPVAQTMRYDGVNGGRGAGRICWEVKPGYGRESNIFCRNHRLSCQNCKFYLRVHSEEEELIASSEIKSEAV